MEFDAANNNANYWAQNAYISLTQNGHMGPAATMAPMDFSKTQTALVPSAFSMAALSSLSHSTADSIERYGQITPPEELSPPVHSLEPAGLDSSLALDAWTAQREMQQLARYEQASPPSQSPQEQHQAPPSPEQTPAAGRATKRRRTSSKPSTANQALPEPTQSADPAEHPSPPKRKRGRPKSQPQPADALSADGYPFPVSSARQSHLEKNRVAAHKCRQRRKEYINGLEARARDNASKNKLLKELVAQLREEVLDLKNILLRHAGCGCWAIDEYIRRCAGDLLGVSHLEQSTAPRPSFSTPMTKLEGSPDMHPASLDSIDMASMSSPDLDDDFSGMDMLRDPEDEDAGMS